MKFSQTFSALGLMLLKSMTANLPLSPQSCNGLSRRVCAYSTLSRRPVDTQPLATSPRGLRGFLFSRRVVPSRHASAHHTGGRQPNKGCTVGALLCPSIAESEALLPDGQTTAASHNRRGLVAPLLTDALKVFRDIQTKKGHSLVT